MRDFTPTPLLDMPFARLEDRQAAQEMEYMLWCEERDALPSSAIQAARDARPSHPLSRANVQRSRQQVEIERRRAGRVQA